MNIPAVAEWRPARRRARIAALQVLYEIDGARHLPERILRERLQWDGTSKRVARYARRLVEGVVEQKEEIDNIIATHAPAWPIAQMAMVDRNLLRVAIYEMTEEDDTPLKTAIDEAVELAKIYGSNSSSRFVNGVLGSVMDAIEAKGRTDSESEREQMEVTRCLR